MLSIISFVSFVNIAILYWFPMYIPLSSHLAVALATTSYFLKCYYLIPISLLICSLIFFAAMAVLKNQIILPIVLFVYMMFDMMFLVRSFFDAWLNDNYFIVMQAIQIFIYTIVVIFMCFYFVSLWKARKILKE